MTFSDSKRLLAIELSFFPPAGLLFQQNLLQRRSDDPMSFRLVAVPFALIRLPVFQGLLDLILSIAVLVFFQLRIAIDLRFESVLQMVPYCSVSLSCSAHNK